MSAWIGLCESAQQLMEKTGVPGVAIGVLHGGQMTTAGFGVTNVDHPLPVTEETLFQIGSITKTFVGTAAMRLAEQGRLDLDTPVQSYLPEFTVRDEAATRGATMRHLLTHTAGWVGDYFDDTGAGADALDRYTQKMADLQQLAPLGTVWSYNNAGFSLAGRLMESVTGDEFADLLTELVLDPLGLTHAYLTPSDAMTHRFVSGHKVHEGVARVARPWPLPRCIVPAGGVICSVPELLTYARFHLGDGCNHAGERLLSAQALNAMQTPQVTVWKNERWGLSWALRTVDGVMQVSHGGSTTGQTTHLLLVPEHDFAVAVLTNADCGGLLTRALTQQALQTYLDIAPENPQALAAPPSALAPYAGFYSRPYADIELGLLNGRLIGQLRVKGAFPSPAVPIPPPQPPFALDLCEEDRLVILDGALKDATVDVVRRDDGAIGWLRTGGRLYPRQEA